MPAPTPAEIKRRYLERRGAWPECPYTRHHLDAYLQWQDSPPLPREAHAQAAVWRNAALRMRPGELIVGLLACREPTGWNYGCGTQVSPDAARGLAEQEGYTAGQRAGLDEDLARVRARGYQYVSPGVFSPEEIASLKAGASTSTWFGGHMVPDYPALLAGGLGGLRAGIGRHEARHGPDKGVFYGAMRVVLGGVAAFTERLAREAESLGMEEAAAALRPLAEGRPPAGFRQALQMAWIIHYLNGADSFGRFDHYLAPFYEDDLRHGRLDRGGAKALLADFWTRIEDAGQIQNMTLGGVDAEGRPAYGDLTLLCLEATREMAFKGPNLCLRVTPDIPESIWEAALDGIGSGLGLPALYNDPVYVENFVRAGVPLATARGYCLAGCSQVMLPGECNFCNDIGLLNAAKVLELALHDGLDPKTGQRAGPPTGAAAGMGSFEQLKEAFYRQLEHACALQVSLHNKEIPYRGSREGYALRTLVTQGCLESGLGVFEGGARHNNVELEIIGLTNAADSLYAVRAAVYEERRVTLPALLEALASDWKGHEDLRAYLRGLPKFGNGHAGVDALRAEITGCAYAYFNRSPGPFGGVYVPGEVIFVTHEGCGAATGATPDGRGAGQVLADSAGAQGGCAREGPTALMNSVLALPAGKHLLTTVVLNLRFLPDTFNAPATRPGLGAMLKGFFAQGGMQLQINVCGAEALREAKARPADHQDLVVRVGGYSEYFVRLSPALQEEIIGRAAF